MKKNTFAIFSLIIPVTIVLLIYTIGYISVMLFFGVWLFSPLGFLAGLILGSRVLFSNWKNKEPFSKKALIGVLINIALLILSIISLKGFGPPP
jgi:hypothetical protein